MGSDDVVLLASASRDLDDGEKFYDDKQKGLGQYFLQSLFADLESLKIYAGIHVKMEKANLYMMRAKRFPYLIYYRMIDRVPMLWRFYQRGDRCHMACNKTKRQTNNTLATV